MSRHMQVRWSLYRSDTKLHFMWCNVLPSGHSLMIRFLWAFIAGLLVLPCAGFLLSMVGLRARGDQSRTAPVRKMDHRVGFERTCISGRF